MAGSAEHGMSRKFSVILRRITSLIISAPGGTVGLYVPLSPAKHVKPVDIEEPEAFQSNAAAHWFKPHDLANQKVSIIKYIDSWRKRQRLSEKSPQLPS